MSTAVTPRQDAELILDLDFDPEPVCEFLRDKCDVTATHQSLWTCGCIQFFCMEHAKRIVHSTHSFWYCSLCRSDGTQLISINRITK